MNIVEEVLKEHSNAMKDRVVRYVGKDPRRFKALIDAFLSDPYRVTQRAAWPLSYCVENHPELIKPHMKRVVACLKADASVSTKRNVMRLLQFVDIPTSLEGKVASAGFDFLSDPKETIAVKAFTIFVMAKIAMRHPEIAKELIIILEDLLPYGGPALVSRATRVLKELKH